MQELRTEAADIADIVQDIARKSVGKNYATLEKWGESHLRAISTVYSATSQPTAGCNANWEAPT